MSVNRIAIAKVVGYSIATVAAVSSYGHQVELLQHAHLDPLFGVVPSEWVTPTTVDSLAIIALIVRTSPTATPAMKRAALFPLILAGGLSVAANVATARNVIQVIVGVWTVLAYILAELFVSRLDNNTAAAAATKPPLAAHPAPPVVATAAPVAVATVAPVPVVAAAPVAPAPVVPVALEPVAAPVTSPVIPPPVVPSASRESVTTNATKPPAVALAPSTTNISVTASDAAQPKPPVPAAMLTRATHIARAHLTTNGEPITAGELAVRMRTDSKVAAQLLAALDLPDNTDKPAAALNGSPVKVTR